MRLQGARLDGRYELVREVSHDSDALLWDGYDWGLDRPVTVKLLQPALVRDAEAIARFSAAARASARLPADSEPRVLDAGRDQQSSIPFVVFQTQREAVPEADAPTRAMPRVRPRARTSTKQRLMLVLLLLPLVAGVVIVRGLLDLSLPTAPLSNPQVVPTAVAVAQPTPAPTQVQPVATARPAVAQPQPTTSPAQTAGMRRRIVNTDGIGVALRTAPDGQRLPGKGYDEGATVTVLEQEGAWSHIRGDDGREGWVLAVTLG